MPNKVGRDNGQEWSRPTRFQALRPISIENGYAVVLATPTLRSEDALPHKGGLAVATQMEIVQRIPGVTLLRWSADVKLM